MDGTRRTLPASLDIKWILASSLGWSAIAIAGELEGFVVGLLQWLVLRRLTRISPLWVAVTGITWWAGVALADRFSPSLFIPDLRWLAATGTAVGLFQWMLLGGRRDRALLWLPVNGASALVSWLVGFSVGFDLYERWWWSNVAYMVAAGAVGGAVAGVITGFPLPWLLRRRARQAAAVHA